MVYISFFVYKSTTTGKFLKMKIIMWKTRKMALFVTVFLSTLIIEFFLVFLHGCSDGEGLAFDIDKQAFVVKQGCVCGGSLDFSGEDAADEFSVIYNKNVHAFWYDSYNPSALEINNLPTCCNVVLRGDTLSLRRLPLRPNTSYDVYRMSGCRSTYPLTIKTDRQGKIVSAGRELQ